MAPPGGTLADDSRPTTSLAALQPLPTDGCTGKTTTAGSRPTTNDQRLVFSLPAEIAAKGIHRISPVTSGRTLSPPLRSARASRCKPGPGETVAWCSCARAGELRHATPAPPARRHEAPSPLARGPARTTPGSCRTPPFVPGFGVAGGCVGCTHPRQISDGCRHTEGSSLRFPVPPRSTPATPRATSR